MLTGDDAALTRRGRVGDCEATRREVALLEFRPNSDKRRLKGCDALDRS